MNLDGASLGFLPFDVNGLYIERAIIYMKTTEKSRQIAVIAKHLGGNTHQPKEWVGLDSAQTVMETLTQFICRWCEIAD